MYQMIRQLSWHASVSRLLMWLLSLAMFAPATAAQSVSPTFTLTGDLQSLTDSWASWGRDPINSRFNPFATRIRTAATTTVSGIVFQGSWDGHLRAHDSRNGNMLWQYDTYRAYTGTNGVSGQGGSINGAGAVVVGDTVYVNSGYSAFGPGTSLSGNVLLAFTLRNN